MPQSLLSLLILVCLPSVACHGRVIDPKPRPPMWRDPNMIGYTSPGSEHRENEPAYTLAGPTEFADHQYTHSAYRCHDFAPTTPETTLTAGSELTLSWYLPANHPGDCSLYISYDEPTTGFEAGSDSSTWFKVHDFQGCVSAKTLADGFDGINPPKDNTDTITLPDWLPSSPHAVLRWEWIAVHVPTLEFFVSCIDVKIDGSQEAPSKALAKISPLVEISGTEHLPTKQSAYRHAYNGEFGPDYIASGPVANYDGAVVPPSELSPPPDESSEDPSPSPSLSPPSAEYQYPSPPPPPATAAPPASETCLPRWGACMSSGVVLGDCCGPYTCYQEHEYYSQCLEACPEGWLCDTDASEPEVEAKPPPSPVTYSPPPSPPPAPTRSPVVSPPDSSDTCIAKWGTCQVSGEGGECCGSEKCHAESQWYAQCRPECPTGWACDWACAA